MRVPLFNVLSARSEVHVLEMGQSDGELPQREQRPRYCACLGQTSCISERATNIIVHCYW